jgi:CRP/FNR family transcriptional regulator, cyclic AMP receptor protein
LSAIDAKGEEFSKQAWEASGLLSIGRYKSFTTDELLFTQNSDAADVAVIRKGIVKITAITSPHIDTFLGIRRTGDLVGEDFAVRTGNPNSDGRPISRKAIALTPGNAIIFSAEQFLYFLREHPDVMLLVAQNLGERLTEAEARIASAARDSADQRLARVLSELHDLGRYGIRGQGYALPRGSEIPVRLSQAELASWIGASRVTVDRALHRLRERGIISTSRRRIVILDLDALIRIRGEHSTGHESAATNH